MSYFAALIRCWRTGILDDDEKTELLDTLNQFSRRDSSWERFSSPLRCPLTSRRPSSHLAASVTALLGLSILVVERTASRQLRSLAARRAVSLRKRMFWSSEVVCDRILEALVVRKQNHESMSVAGAKDFRSVSSPNFIGKVISDAQWLKQKQYKANHQQTLMQFETTGSLEGCYLKPRQRDKSRRLIAQVRHYRRSACQRLYQIPEAMTSVRGYRISIRLINMANDGGSPCLSRFVLILMPVW